MYSLQAKASRPCWRSNRCCPCSPWSPGSRPTISPPSTFPLLPGRVPGQALHRLYIARDNDAAGIKAAERLRERAAGLDIRDLVPVHADFNLDLCRLGAEGMLAHLGDQLVPADRMRFAPHRSNR
jgi:hypothetical protein